MDDYVSANPLHVYEYQDYEWLSEENPAATVTYDFGNVRTFDRFSLWNEEFSGIGSLDILGSVDGDIHVDPLRTGAVQQSAE